MMMDAKKSRLVYIDNLKGFLILLVVFGHCIQTFDPDFDHNYIFKWIYGFHMPLFVFVSGYVSYNPVPVTRKLGKRALQLLVPFFAWGLIGMLLNGNCSFDWVVYPDKGLWFLWTLFFIVAIHTLFFAVARRYRIRDDVLLGAVSLLLIGIQFKTKLAFGTLLIARYLPFYLLGWYTRRYELAKGLLRGTRARSVLTLVAMLAVYTVAVVFWDRNGYHSFLPHHDTFVARALAPGYKFVVGLFGCYLFLWLSRLFDYSILVISNLGGMTLGIYAIHQSVVAFARDIMEGAPLSLGVSILIAFVCAFAVTLLLYRILKCSELTSRILLGEPAKNSLPPRG